tara:strand:+ start:2306 stop:5599 length:3294 start_codon:yes stop_codon:yes gene_type:complete
MADIHKYTSKEVLNKVLLDSSGNAVDAYSHTTSEALNAALDATNSRINVNLKGGTISGDVTISGDLTVEGGGVLAFDEILEGTQQIKVTDPVALLVEKADGTDVFVVDTTNSRVGIGTSSPVAQGLTVANAGDVNLTLLADSDANGADNWPMVDFRVDNVSGNPEARIYYKQSITSLVLATNNTNAIVINSSGNVGIGTTSPTEGNLVVQGSAGGSLILENSDVTLTDGEVLGKVGFYANDSSTNGTGEYAKIEVEAVGAWSNATVVNGETRMKFYTTDNAGSPVTSAAMTIDSSGNVGIGTDSPLQGQSTPITGVKLDVLGSQMLSSLSATNTDQSKLFFFRSDGAVGSQGAVPDGLKIGAIEWAALTSGDNNNSISAGRIETEASSAWSSASARNADMTFSTIGANTLAERMRIDSAGNVGIGRTSPDSVLHVQSTTVAGLRIGYGGAAVNYFDADTQHFRNSATSTTQMTLTSTGKVGIGTPSPDTNLHIYENAGSDTEIKVENIHASGSAIFKAVSHTGRWAQIQFGDTADEDRARVAYDNNNDKMLFKVNGSADASLVIDSAGRVGIGTDSPSSQDGSADNLVIEAASGNVGITIKTANTSVGAIHFSDGTSGADTYRGMIAYKHGDEEMRFRANAVQVMVIDANSRISLSNNDGGAGNTIFGKNAGLNLDVGSNYNVFIGDAVSDAAMNNATYNVGIGYQSLTDLTTGDSNHAIGGYSQYDNSTGNNNISIGINSLYFNTGADNNIAIGGNSGKYTTGADNTYVGFKAGLGAAGAEANNVGVGSNALLSITTGFENTVVGVLAGDALTVGGRNASLGHLSLSSDTKGDRSVAIGRSALETQNFTSTTNAYNTGVGYYAGRALTTGINNTLIGGLSGDVIQAGTQNTIIGAGSDPSAHGGINQTVIGYGTTGVADNSVTLGNADVTAVYMASDSGAVVHAAGVNFPDTFANSADVNTLDDYEEGTWTPTFVIETGSNFSYDTQSGFYTKIGNVVHAWCHLQIDKTAGTNNLSVRSWPFASHDDGQSKYFPILISNYALADGMTVGWFYANSAIMFLGHLPENGAIDIDNNGAELDNTTNITIDINITYRTDE